MITIKDILFPNHILLDLATDTKSKAISNVADLLEKDSRMKDWDRFYKGLAKGTTCMTNDSGSSICIAHVRSKGIKSMVMAVGRSVKGIECKEESLRIRLVFVIGVPSALASDYLRIIGALARIFRTEKGEAALMNAQTQEEFLDTLSTLEMEM